MLQKAWEWLKGKKTYICAIAVGVTKAAQYAGWEIPDIVVWCELLLGAASMRAGMAKAEAAAKVAKAD